jgi:NitT/TauT family transport system substrate-binding protein
MRTRVALAAVIGLAIVSAAWAGRAHAADAVQLQLKWVTQAQFAGYYAAKARGLYAAEGLDVTIRPGGPDIVPEQVVAGGGAQFGIDWLPSLLSARDQGVPLVDIAQVFAASAMRQLAFKSSGIKSAADLRGRRVAVWFGGNEFELLATLAKSRIDRAKDVTLVQQPFDMNLLLQRRVDAAAAMTYNEYKQVLDAGVKPEDLVVIDFNREGTAMLEDGVLHQTWMMTEINKLIWGPPAPKTPLGRMDPEAFKRTAGIAHTFGVIKKPADAGAYTHEIWELARKK